MRKEIRFDAIMAADLHLRSDCPSCREPEEFFPAQRRKLLYIKELCFEHKCPLLIAGDLFDHWSPSASLISMALSSLPPEVYAIPGQHDLQNHSLSSFAGTGLHALSCRDSGIHPLFQSKPVLEGYKSIYIPGMHVSLVGLGFGEEIGGKDTPVNSREMSRKILMWHALICEEKDPWPDAGAFKARRLLRRLPDFDLVLTGDNHQQFSVEVGKQVLLNPGSMMRQTSDQASFEPAVYGWQALDNSITRLSLPIKKGVVLKAEKKEKRKEREERMEAYIKRATEHHEAKLSFVKNLEKHFRKNKEPEGVEEKTWEAVNE